MILDPKQYDFLTTLINHKEEIQIELNTFLSTKNKPFDIEHSKYLHYWILDNGLNDKDYRIGHISDIPIYKKGYPNTLINVEEKFPKLLKLLSRVKSVQFACFTLAESNSGIDTHSHNRSHLIFHLLMNDLDKHCSFKVENEVVKLKNFGDTILFNYSLPHSTYNYSNCVRISLMVDFIP